jgi:cyclopropane fatty-acyl-phospholipid synthase-like methyltransferase
VTSDDILLQLMALAERHPEFGLLQFNRLASARQYARAYDLARRHVPQGSTVLDWGCGNGHMSFALDAMGYRTTGYSLDPAPPLAASAPGCSFVTGSMDDPATRPFPDSAFDAVFSIGVLEHVRETGGTEHASLTEIRRVLKPGGSFICYHFPNRYSYIEMVAQAIPGAHHHEYRYVANDIRALCAEAGFDVVELRRYGATPRNPWQVLPRAIADSRLVANCVDAVDAALAIPLAPIVQNYCFVARKP